MGYFSIVDLGFGNSNFLYGLYQNKALNNTKEIVGVDISKAIMGGLGNCIRSH